MFQSRRSRCRQLVQEANRLKVQKRYLDAGHKYFRAARLSMKKTRKKQRSFDAAHHLTDAANCYAKRQPACAVLCLQSSAAIYAELGQFSLAAGQHEKIAELAEKLPSNCRSAELEVDEQLCGKLMQLKSAALSGKPIPSGNWKLMCLGKQHQEAGELWLNPRDLALNHLEKAADFFESEQSPASAAACRDKRARIEADGGQLDRAADGFLKLADWAASDSMLSSCVTDYAFKACLCELAAASRSDRLQSGLRHLGRSDEADLVKALAGATSVAAFDEALIAFQRFNNVDDWCERRLKEVKLRIGHSKKHSLV